jgi:hypothetical protein
LNKKPSWDDIRFQILFPFERVFIDTMDSESDSITIWLSPSVWLRYLRQCVYKTYPPNNLKDCLTYRKLIEWERSVQWIYLAAYSGAYESIGRELRFLVEDMSLSINIDNEHKTSNLEGKVEMVPKRIKSGNLFKGLKVSDEIRNKLKENYDELCGYVHPSKEIVRTAITKPKFIFTFIVSQFKELQTIFCETMDLMLTVLLSHFPKAIESYLEYETEYTGALKYVLYHFEYWNTLNLCTEHSPESFNEAFFGKHDYPDSSECDDQ